MRRSFTPFHSPRLLVASLLFTALISAAGCRTQQTKLLPPRNISRSTAERLRDSPTVAATNAFGFELFRRLDSAKAPGTGNVFISPFSILQAMTMATNGAGGETQAEMLRALHLKGIALSTVNADQKKLLALLSSTKKDSENCLVIANSLWVDQRLKLAPGFVSTANDFYNAPARTLDFEDPTGAASKIDKWVSTSTRGKITELFSPGELKGPPPVDVVLANAVYFKAAWRTPFSERDTSPKPFTLESGIPVTVPTMHQANMVGIEEGISYYKGDGFAMASLSYDSQDSNGYRSMLLILPDAPDGLDSILEKLTPENWSGWQKKLTPMVEVDLSLPRFTLEYETSLISSLHQMGMRRAFDQDQADLKPMGLPNHFIRLVGHKTFLEVNEKGTEAAAVTGIGAASGGEMPPVEKVVFHVDRPFLCAIVDDTTEAVLFLGVIRDPSAGN